MDEQRKGKVKVWMPLLFSIIMVVGMVLGFNLRDSLRNKRDIQTIIERNDRLEEIIDLIKEKYVDTVNSNLLYKNAVNGILSHLDPHTVYIPADELQSVNEDLEGEFFGIGVEFSIVRDTIEVTSVIKGGPAEHAGVQVGDQLIKVGDSVVAGKKITSDHIISMLKGKQHTLVTVTLREPLSGTERQVPITRDIVPIFSVDAGVMLDSITGFIKIDRFSANTYDEFMDALKQLKKQGMKQLILDLRDNPGGYLDAATSIADEFLSGDKLIVYTKGVHSPKREYKAHIAGLFEDGKLAVLVDESSASASEILSGSIQDWDRGVLIGRRTFGKGLVQEQFQMEDDAALRLTVAKYYTPSGRCIQRSFADGKAAYEMAFEHRFETGELTGNDSVENRPADTTKYFTADHRVVYGGGGIKPDVYVPYDTSHFSTGLLSMVFSEDLKVLIWDYFIHNRTKLNKYKDLKDYQVNFKGQNDLEQKYLANIKDPKNKKAAKKILSDPISDSYFKMQIKAQLARFLYNDNGYYFIKSKDDNVVQKALQVFYTDSTYSKIIRR